MHGCRLLVPRVKLKAILIVVPVGLDGFQSVYVPLWHANGVSSGPYHLEVKSGRQQTLSWVGHLVEQGREAFVVVADVLHGHKPPLVQALWHRFLAVKCGQVCCRNGPDGA
eukprot:Plantae.Rhodophyta-Purpureofilum_apyrenoidigerum.ctg34547.p1 GENE.Plantae.Rhodophyta-Purpureofilum_apyrenoidigerum.ctg34547~~Plantae.Rhodophyta-Purpureofilum_apyrenoidigerum.ctg34547.p1  ORF type:complete len:111 (+),score=2.09 Plantae.Rhodophyta-Purpureofilum_apyrenoidigerum.ctg34547:40-372(+)